MLVGNKIRLSHSSQLAFESYLAENMTNRRLQLGAGTNHLDGWFNTDLVPNEPEVYFLDSRVDFPFPTDTFDYLYSEHHIEHLSYREGTANFRECLRVLKPGGRIRIATPDLRVLIGLLGRELGEIEKQYMQYIANGLMKDGAVASPVFVINNAFQSWGHKFLYDYETLHCLLGACGFVNIERVEYGESVDPILRETENHGKSMGEEEMVRFETMVIEASAP